MGGVRGVNALSRLCFCVDSSEHIRYGTKNTQKAVTDFLLVDLRDFFYRFRVGETKKNLKMTS